MNAEPRLREHDGAPKRRLGRRILAAVARERTRGDEQAELDAVGVERRPKALPRLDGGRELAFPLVPPVRLDARAPARGALPRRRRAGAGERDRLARHGAGAHDVASRSEQPRGVPARAAAHLFRTW